jgi:hypothetical protein
MTVKNGLHISFTFNAQDYKNCRDTVKRRMFDSWRLEEKENDTKNYSRFYSIDQVFSELDIENATMIDLPWFYDISSWEKYCKFISSEESSTIIKKQRLFTREKRKKFATDLDVREEWAKSKQEEQKND